VWDLGMVCSNCAIKMFCCAMKTCIPDSSEQSQSSILQNGFEASVGVSGTNKEGSSGSCSNFLVFPAMLGKRGVSDRPVRSSPFCLEFILM
jgi:hypothetical protein